MLHCQSARTRRKTELPNYFSHLEQEWEDTGGVLDSYAVKSYLSTLQDTWKPKGRNNLSPGTHHLPGWQESQTHQLYASFSNTSHSTAFMGAGPKN